MIDLQKFHDWKFGFQNAVPKIEVLNIQIIKIYSLIFAFPLTKLAHTNFLKN